MTYRKFMLLVVQIFNPRNESLFGFNSKIIEHDRDSQWNFSTCDENCRII